LEKNVPYQTHIYVGGCRGRERWIPMGGEGKGVFLNMVEVIPLK